MPIRPLVLRIYIPWTNTIWELAATAGMLSPSK